MPDPYTPDPNTYHETIDLIDGATDAPTVAAINTPLEQLADNQKATASTKVLHTSSATDQPVPAWATHYRARLIPGGPGGGKGTEAAGGGGGGSHMSTYHEGATSELGASYDVTVGAGGAGGVDGAGGAPGGISLIEGDIAILSSSIGTPGGGPSGNGGDGYSGGGSSGTTTGGNGGVAKGNGGDGGGTSGAPGEGLNTLSQVAAYTRASVSPPTAAQGGVTIAGTSRSCGGGGGSSDWLAPGVRAVDGTAGTGTQSGTGGEGGYGYGAGGGGGGGGNTTAGVSGAGAPGAVEITFFRAIAP